MPISAVPSNINGTEISLEVAWSIVAIIEEDSSGNLYRNDTGDVWGDGNYNNGLLRNIDTGEELHCDYHGNCFYE